MKKTASIEFIVPLTLWFLFTATMVSAGPYSYSIDYGPSSAADIGIPGFVGMDGDGNANLEGANTNNYVNPGFALWADSFTNYFRSDAESGFSDGNTALGPVTGSHVDVVSLGDMTEASITNGDDPGTITLTFAAPIVNKEGHDLAVFENGFVNATNRSFFAELAYVEASSDGIHFIRFPSVSLTPEIDHSDGNGYDTINGTDVYNLAGKHANAYNRSWGTPFELDDLTKSPACVAFTNNVITLAGGGTVDLNHITHVRIVDIPGTGDFSDQAAALIDPETGSAYAANHSIYDAWLTYGSGGFDLEAVGAIHAAGWNYVRVLFNDGGWIEPYGMPMGKVSVPQGTDKTFTIEPQEHYHTESITINGAAADPALIEYTFYNISSDTNVLEVTFAIDQHTVTLTHDGEGQITPAAGLYDYGTVTNFTAMAGPYAQFDHWSGDLPSGANPSNTMLSVTITNDLHLTAHFTENITTNRVPKAWLLENNLSDDASGALSDTDNDGLQAWEEYLIGTSPTNHTVSGFRLEIPAQSDEPCVRFETIPFRRYIIESSTDLKNWDTTAAQDGDGTPAEITLPSAPSPVYYRGRIIFIP